MFVCCNRKVVLLVKWHTIKCLRFNLGFSWYVLPALNCSCLLVIRQKLLLTTHHFHHTNTSEGENDITLFDDKSWRIAAQARVWLASALQGLVLLFCGRQTDLHWKQLQKSSGSVTKDRCWWRWGWIRGDLSSSSCCSVTAGWRAPSGSFSCQHCHLASLLCSTSVLPPVYSWATIVIFPVCTDSAARY